MSIKKTRLPRLDLRDRLWRARWRLSVFLHRTGIPLFCSPSLGFLEWGEEVTRNFRAALAEYEPKDPEEIE